MPELREIPVQEGNHVTVATENVLRPVVGRRFAVFAALMAVAVLTAIWGIYKFSNFERDRDLQVWQNRLGLIADTRTRDIGQWLARQKTDLNALAENASLQIYMTELTAGGPDSSVSDDLARSGYLQSLLTVVAHRAGFVGPERGPRVNANVRRIGVAGIALLAMDGSVLAASPGTPPLDGGLARFMAATPRGESARRDLYLNSSNGSSMAFVAPVFSVQGRGDRDSQVGWVLGVKEVTAELFPLLRQPGAVWKTTEALLLRRAGEVIDYLSPTRAGDAPLTRQFAADTAGLAAAFAIARPGGFAQRRDYQGKDVLVTARRIPSSSWILAYKIDREEALGPGDAAARRLVILLLLALATVVALIIAAWRHGTSVKAARAAAEYHDMARRYEAQSHFLKLVTDTQPNVMFIVDDENRYRFVNKRVVDGSGIDEGDLIGKTIASVMGPAAAARYENLNSAVLASGKPRVHIHRDDTNGSLRVVQSEHVPVAGEYENDTGGHSVLVVEEDITAVVVERERSERTLEGLIETLVSVLDRRDPYSAKHSTRVAATAGAIACEMGLDGVGVRTVITAGRLMNIGKILVSEDVLTKPGNLGEDEVQLIRDGLAKSAELIEGVEFDGPVADIIRHVQNGAGTGADSVDELIRTGAQIVAVANAFVAISSPRAWRDGLDVKEAAGFVSADSEGRYARPVVSALLNLVDNKGFDQMLTVSVQ